MDIKRLDTFLAIVDTGTFAAAADEMRTGQSSVSASIRVLERDLGAQLFDRSARTAVLTAAGRALVPRARALSREAALTRRLVQEAEKQLSGELRLGVISSIDPFPLPRILREFTATHPLVWLRVLTDSVGTYGLLDRLQRSELDLAIVAAPFPQFGDTELITAQLAAGELVCITAPDDPIAERRHLELGDVAGRTWIEAPAGQTNRASTDAAFAAAHLTRTVSVEIGVPSDVPDYVAAGVGLAFVPDFLVQGRDDVRILPLQDARLHWSTTLTRLPERDSELIRACWEAVVRAGQTE